MRNLALSFKLRVYRAVEALRATAMPFRWPVVFLAGYLAVDMWWTTAVHIGIAGVPGIACFVTSAFGLGIVLNTIGKAAPNFKFAAGLRVFGDGLAYFGIGSCGAALTAIFIFPCNRLARPFRDAAYARVDAALGFHWPDWVSFVHAHAIFDAIVRTGYYTHILQYMAAYFVFAFLADKKRAAEFFWSVNLAGIATGLVSGLFPAVGARTHFLHVSSPWLPELLAARLPGFAEFTVAHTVGIAQMPSYHATLAALFTWATRRTGPFGWAVAALNGAMLLGTPSEGGHYLVDVLAGLSIAIVVVLGVRRAMSATAVGLTNPTERHSPQLA